ncbi:hypothetical protein DSO57_1027207 [Entomophthora muscae]|uniref:Uncharacterized protein n=1 Tax=Entomophthora muscae TaxID=34485 RepID=A0ACC2UB98_9FUNG|nr:hypothetical protein DSO57_1027207 [Entomophthora muscae]
MNIYLLLGLAAVSTAFLWELWDATVGMLIRGPDPRFQTLKVGQNPFGKWYSLPGDTVWAGSGEFGSAHFYTPANHQKVQVVDFGHEQRRVQEVSRSLYVTDDGLKFASPNLIVYSEYNVTTIPIMGDTVFVNNLMDSDLIHSVASPIQTFRPCAGSRFLVRSFGSWVTHFRQYDIYLQLDVIEQTLNLSRHTSVKKYLLPILLETGKCDTFVGPA